MSQGHAKGFGLYFPGKIDSNKQKREKMEMVTYT